MTFVDVEAGIANWSAVRSWFATIPPSLIVRASTILVRWPPEWNEKPDQVANDDERNAHLADLSAQLRGRGVIAHLGFAIFALGQPPRILWHEPRPDGEDDSVLLQRARRMELSSYLVWGGAIWRPNKYHYVLPSGHHAKTFVRVADGLRDVRAAAALATWLYAGISKDIPTTIVVDSGTLSPIINELSSFARENGSGISRVLSLDSHPVSRYEYRRLIKPAEGMPVLGVISVSATGHLHDHFQVVLKETVGNEFRLERLVARTEQEQEATFVPTEDVKGSQHPWLNLHERLDLPVTTDGSNCAACRTSKIARLVHIHPGSMSAMALPEPVRLVPDLFDGTRNRTLWQRYEASPREALSHAGPTNTRPRDTRQTGGDSQLFFEPYLLVNQNDPAQFIASRHEELSVLPRRFAGDPDVDQLAQAVNALPKPVDSVVIDSDEYRQFQGNELSDLLDGLKVFFGQQEVAIYEHQVTSQAPGGQLDQKTAHGAPNQNVAILALGLRSGVTLQRSFLTVRSQWPAAKIGALVMHAHSSDTRIWDSIRNTFRDQSGVSRMLALWLTYLPRRSPLDEERSLLLTIDNSELDPELRAIREDRKSGTPSQFLWGPPNARLRPTSYFGENLSDWTVVAAVGSAMQSARLQARKDAVGGPHWAVFDLPRVFRSYFDGLIHASVLRWLTPSEAWWGQSGDECVSLVQEIEQRSTDDWKTLFPELLLAGAQSKVPKEGVKFLISRAVDIESEGNWEPADLLWVRLGRALCEFTLASI